MINSIHHVGIHTSDLDQLSSFYERAFGFEIVGKEERLEAYPEARLVVGIEGDARVLLMRSRNCLIELFEWSEPKPCQAEPLAPNDLGYTHICVTVDDIDKEYERLVDLGMTFVHPSPVRVGTDRASVYGRDPGGNIIEILELPEGDELTLEAVS